jgi:hypothetical protein
MQLLGSLVVALAIIAVTIALVTAKLGPNAEQHDGGHGGDKQEQVQPDNSGKGSDGG